MDRVTYCRRLQVFRGISRDAQNLGSCTQLLKKTFATKSQISLKSTTKAFHMKEAGAAFRSVFTICLGWVIHRKNEEDIFYFF